MSNATDFMFNVGDKIWVSVTLPLKHAPRTVIHTTVIKARMIDADTGTRFYYIAAYRSGNNYTGFNEQLLNAEQIEQTHTLLKE